MRFQDSYLGQLRARVGSRPLLAVGARMLIEDDQGRFLTLRRADDGKWGLPGGAMELGESLPDVVHREALEEVGVTLRDVTVFGLSSDPKIECHRYPNGDEVQNVSLLAHAFVAEGQVCSADNESHEVRFVRFEDIDPVSFVIPEYPTFARWQAFCRTSVFQIV